MKTQTMRMNINDKAVEAMFASDRPHPLSDVPVGQTVRVEALLNLSAPLKARLTALGLVPGTELVVERRMPFGGPVVVRFADQRFALRRTDAGGIVVRGEPRCEFC